MRQIIFIISFILLINSCEKMLLGEQEKNTPENNFELFWTDFNEHYGLFQARQKDWDSIYSVYRPQVNLQTNDAELWLHFSEMLNYLDDGHNYLENPSNGDFYYVDEERDFRTLSEFSIPLIKSKYVEQIQTYPGESPIDNYFYGKIKNKDIGYIYLEAMDMDDNDAMDVVLDEIGTKKAIILDIRNNEGGYDISVEAVAGRFADGRHLAYTIKVKNGPNPNDFSEEMLYYIDKIGENNYVKPVIILTDQSTISAAEVFLMYTVTFEHVTVIGDTTSGDYADASMIRFLPNGWQYVYSIMDYRSPDGISLDGIGNIPDVYIRNTEAHIMNGSDKVIERAIQYLFDVYGIE